MTNAHQDWVALAWDANLFLMVSRPLACGSIIQAGLSRTNTGASLLLLGGVFASLAPPPRTRRVHTVRTAPRRLNPIVASALFGKVDNEHSSLGGSISILPLTAP